MTARSGREPKNATVIVRGFGPVRSRRWLPERLAKERDKAQLEWYRVRLNGALDLNCL
jgi:hypothetical protein